MAPKVGTAKSAPTMPPTVKPPTAASMVTGADRLTARPTTVGTSTWLLSSMKNRNATDMISAGTTPAVRLTTNTRANPMRPPIWGISDVRADHTPSTGLSGTPASSATMATHMPLARAIRRLPAKYLASTA